ncbi:MAG: hypothetical protein JOZ22_26770, partial [Acidobacteriia bacterium]|nr:hypothetical protein [Terriglobia bacterium]
TGGLPAGCLLQAVIDNGTNGASQPFPLARILRMPQIDSFTVSADPPANGMRQYQLTGQNLELIDKLGWDDHTGISVLGLPTPLAGPGMKQSITLNLPDPPASDAALYVWLRGDQQGRLATIKAPALPAPPPPPATAPPAPQ